MNDFKLPPMGRRVIHAETPTGLAHYWSRSRQQLWKKGESSGMFQNIQRILIDDDQDCGHHRSHPHPAHHRRRGSLLPRWLPQLFLSRNREANRSKRNTAPEFH